MQFDHILDFKSLQVKIASPEEISEWSHGEVTKPETINYRTLKPEKDGLFCEKIFGPVNDYQCYCGKYKRIRYRGIICDKCGVEVTHSRVRRERMGHIKLACPVSHVWYFKGAPSKLSLLLNINPTALESVIYFAQYIITQTNEPTRIKTKLNLNQQLTQALEKLKLDNQDQINQIKKELQSSEKQLKSKIRSKEQLNLALQELQLKSKRRIQNTQEKLSKDKERTQSLFDQLNHLVAKLQPHSLLTEEEYQTLADYHATDFIKVDMGAEAIHHLTAQIDLEKLAADLREEISQSKGQKLIKANKRLHVINGLRRSHIKPEWMILTVLPVLPPDLRPMVQLAGGRFASSDLNDLYRRVINRNNRLKHLMDLGAPEIILRNEKRMLQEAVDSLLDASQRKTTSRRQIQLKSLSDILKGKQGRFRQNLLGKRVDYSGRSVIIVGPELRLNQCGLPKDMALEMFKPFILRQLILTGLAPNVKSAKNVIDQRLPEVFDILEEISHNHPVLLNRAPTLHKLGIQAFYPILIEGNAIKVHPCVCDAYNADFDGDQMAIHIPLSKPARQEAEEQMMPIQNLLRPSDGSPITVPARKEMALGSYYLTSIDESLPLYSTIFYNFDEALYAYQTQYIKTRQPIKVKYQNQIITTTIGRILFNQILPPIFDFVNESITQPHIKTLFNRALKTCTSQQLLNMIDDIKDQGFWAGTISGLTVAGTDCLLLPEKSKIIDQANQQVSEIEENYKLGLITSQERQRLTQEVWIDTTEELADKTWEIFTNDNPVKIIIDAKVGRTTREQIKQLSAMKGLVVDPNGKIVDMPTKSNYREGLTIFEYVTSARGGRKGLTDTAIKTADAGYLTRRLVDVAHDMIVRLDDCGTTEGITIARGNRDKIFSKRLMGRFLAQDVTHPQTKIVIYSSGHLLSDEDADYIDQLGLDHIQIRSPLNCQAPLGICIHCYGWDLAQKKICQIGYPAGIIAAQSIGEPGTQLTMRTKHSAGVIGVDVTQGLPRVEELLEARTPKSVTPIAEISGRVTIQELDEYLNITIKTVGIRPAQEQTCKVPATAKLLVTNKQLVSAGDPLVSGPLDIKEVLKTRGLRRCQEYLVENIQQVYESQGIPINDKHFEVIVRKMSDKVRISSPGDTPFLIGEIVNRSKLEIENRKIIAEGGEPASAQIIILGITRASLHTDSWLSAASFIQTTNVLADAAATGSIDELHGLKENVIIGRLIPTSPDRAAIEATV